MVDKYYHLKVWSHKVSSFSIEPTDEDSQSGITNCKLFGLMFQCFPFCTNENLCNLFQFVVEDSVNMIPIPWNLYTNKLFPVNLLQLVNYFVVISAKDAGDRIMQLILTD